MKNLLFQVNSVLKSLLSGFNHKQNASVKLRGKSNEFYHRGLTIINFLRIFRTGSIKKLKKLANFFKFQSISIHAISSDRRQETVLVPPDNL